MVTRTEGSGIRYDTKVRTPTKSSKSMPTPTKSKSGSQKLAEFREATGDSTPTQTPEQYRQKVETQKTPTTPVEPAPSPQQPTLAERYTTGYYQFKAQEQPTSTITPQQMQKIEQLQAGGELRQPTKEELQTISARPAPVSEGYAPTYDYFYGSQPKDMSSPHNLGNQSSLITSRPQEDFKPETTKFQEELNVSTESAFKKGVSDGESIKLSKTSETLVNVAGKLDEAAMQYRANQDILFPGRPVEGTIATRAATSITGLAGMGLRLPAGVEIVAQQPSLLVPAATIAGAGMLKYVTETPFKDPVQIVTDLVVFGGATSLAGKGIKGVSNKIKFASKEQIPIETLARPEVIAGKVNFPTAKQGTPTTQVIQTFKETSTRYPGEVVPGRDYGIHVSNIELPTKVLSKKLTTIEGTSETPGLYVGPDASLYFARTTQGPSKITLFGRGEQSPQPTINFVGMRSIERLPTDLRTNTGMANLFMKKQATKETGYTTVKMEKGLQVGPRERELVIPPESLFKEIETKYYTEYSGQKIPVKRFEPYEAIESKPIVQKTPGNIIEKLTGKEPKKARDISSYSSRTGIREYPIITPKRISSISMASSSRPKIQSSMSKYVPSSSYNKYSSSVSPSVSKSVSALSSGGRDISHTSYSPVTSSLSNSLSSRADRYVSQKYQTVPSDITNIRRKSSAKTKKIKKSGDGGDKYKEEDILSTDYKYKRAQNIFKNPYEAKIPKGLI